ncbi:hypothetical protein C8F01DRAFT_1367372 [Mycena amicta]|nr:hypothetical protein C8F01DRAFT_1367372 [Mycena amicta]
MSARGPSIQDFDYLTISLRCAVPSSISGLHILHTPAESVVLAPITKNSTPDYGMFPLRLHVMLLTLSHHGLKTAWLVTCTASKTIGASSSTGRIWEQTETISQPSSLLDLPTELLHELPEYYPDLYLRFEAHLIGGHPDEYERVAPSNTPPPPQAPHVGKDGGGSDVESLRDELVVTRRRADRAERLLSTFGSISASMATLPAPAPNGDVQGPTDAPDDTNTTNTQPLPAATAALLVALDDRTTRAESARDDAAQRLAALASTWTQLNDYLQLVEARALDARAGFGRIVKEGGGRLVLMDVPPVAGAGGALYPSSYGLDQHRDR